MLYWLNVPISNSLREIISRSSKAGEDSSGKVPSSLRAQLQKSLPDKLEHENPHQTFSRRDNSSLSFCPLASWTWASNSTRDNAIFHMGRHSSFPKEENLEGGKVTKEFSIMYVQVWKILLSFAQENETNTFHVRKRWENNFWNEFFVFPLAQQRWELRGIYLIKL